jgi:hypothetical protein
MMTARQKVSGRSIIELLILLFVSFAGIGGGVLLARLFHVPILLMAAVGVIVAFASLFGLQALTRKLHGPIFPPCPQCGVDGLQLKGSRDANGRLVWLCERCGRSFAIKKRNHTTYFVDRDNPEIVFYEHKAITGWKPNPGTTPRQSV